MNSYIETNKILWKEHFENTRLNYPNEEVVRFLTGYQRDYPNGTLLDWGCATGRHTTLACQLGYRVYAADYVANNIAITRQAVETQSEQTGKVEKYIVNQNLDVTEIGNATMDLILAWGLLFYNTLENQCQMIKNIYRMLKKGGRCFCDFRTNRDSIAFDRTIGAETDENSTYILQAGTTAKQNLLCHLSSYDELTDVFKNAGLKPESIELYEFTQNNRKIRNSWYHATLLKEE